MQRALYELFSRSAAKYPSRPALIFDDTEVDYQTLEDYCNRIAAVLFDLVGDGRKLLVGVLTVKDVEVYAALLAILKSRNIYVPINPNHPLLKQIEFIDEANIDVLLLSGSASRDLSRHVLEHRPNIAVIEIGPGGHVTKFDGTRFLRSASSAPETQSPASDDADIAYIMFTSGSTGRPKGVIVTQQGVSVCIEKIYRLLGTNETDRFSQFSELSFDFGISDIFLCWRSGGALCVPSDRDKLVPTAFAKRSKLTVWSSVPTLVANCHKLGLLKNQSFPDIRLCLFSGEALTYSLVKAWSASLPRCKIVNLYGPTEVTIYATYFVVEPGFPGEGVVPIGEPLPGVHYRVVADHIDSATVPETGELWLGGEQVALGYWNNEVATAERFVEAADANQGSARWYRTGDLVNYDPGRGLCFRGRMDRQIKLSGHRVELQDLEHTISKAIGLEQVVVVALRNADGEAFAVIAFIEERSLRREATLSPYQSKLHELCKTHLPAPLIPQRFVQIRRLPLSSNGKLDYRALERIAEDLLEMAPVFPTRV
jgi:D-alanine--poly(phosphoribitol) ligase subunit 1